MYCNNCNAQLAENALFCHKCGIKVNDKLETETCNSVQNSDEITDINPETTPKTISYTTKQHKLKFIKSAAGKFKNISRKKRIILICSLILIIGTIVLVVCLNSGSSSSSYSSSYNSSYSLEDSLETIATSALYNELRQRFSYTDVFNLGATRYSIGSITETDTQWIVRGTFSLYDYYGKITSYYNETFSVKIDKNTHKTTCTISL